MIKYILQTKETQQKDFYSYYLFSVLHGVFYFFNSKSLKVNFHKAEKNPGYIQCY